MERRGVGLKGEIVRRKTDEGVGGAGGGGKKVNRRKEEAHCSVFKQSLSDEGRR